MQRGGGRELEAGLERMKRIDKDWKTMNRMMIMTEEEGEEKASVTEEGGQEELKEEE